jgi:hypothetical protein
MVRSETPAKNINGLQVEYPLLLPVVHDSEIWHYN